MGQVTEVVRKIAMQRAKTLGGKLKSEEQKIVFRAPSLRLVFLSFYDAYRILESFSDVTSLRKLYESGVHEIPSQPIIGPVTY